MLSLIIFQTLISILNRELQLINEYSFDKMLGIFFFLTSKVKLKQRRYVSKFHLIIYGLINSFAELDYFLMLEEYFLIFLCYSQCKGYRHHNVQV